MTKIKFCGNKTAAAIEAMNEILPDYAGFILSPRFRRYVPKDELTRLTAMLDRRIKRVGVFVDNPFEEVKSALESGIIDIAQLHGSEDDNFILRLKELTKKPIIKAFKIASDADIIRARSSPADYILLDSGTGTGKSFDWSLIKNLGREFFLAGGLCPENAAEAIEKCRPYCLDVSSGIETDGEKDPEKMKKFAENVRRIK